MLGKLLKYEFKATSRTFLLMYAGVLVLAMITAITSYFAPDIYTSTTPGFAKNLSAIMEGLVVTLYIVAITALFVATLVIIVVRFYRMLGDEGYLWFTLPVTADQHLISKLIVGTVWSLASFVVLLLSFLILATPAGLPDIFKGIAEFWRDAVSNGFHPSLWIICGIFLIVVSFVSSILTYYTAIAIGPNIIKSRLGGTVLAYLIITVAIQIISSIFTAAVMPAFVGIMQRIDRLPYDSQLYSVAGEQALVLGTLLYGLLLIAFAIAGYFISRHFMTKKLNLA
ncbi:MAG: hypothetical protein FWG00_03855 [Coriobacteriia bacterium]|nr:hypothetical protein [Coriobacteriia bacterium]